MNGPYDDIINLPHPVSTSHPRMSVIDRAAQFSPFAALTGYDTAIRETARLTNEKIELDESARAALGERLCMIQDQIKDHPVVCIIYFQPDNKKTGGAYITVAGAVKKINEYERLVIMDDGTKIPIDDILEISGNLFTHLEDFGEYL